EAVAAVVAAPAYDHRAAALPAPAEHGSRALAGALHEHLSGRAVRDRPLVEGPHLTRRDDQHAGPQGAPMAARAASTMPSAMPRISGSRSPSIMMRRSGSVPE